MADLIQNCSIQLLKNPSERLLFSYMPREGIRDEKSAEWSSIEILGRQEPWRSWAHSSPRSLSFQLEFYAQDRIFEDVQQRVDWLRSLVYPDMATFTGFATAVSIAPPVILLNVGALFQNVRCVVKTVGVNWRAPWGSDAHHDTLPDPPGFMGNSAGEARVAVASALKGALSEVAWDLRPMYAIVDIALEEIAVGLTGGKPFRASPLKNPSPRYRPMAPGPIPIPKQRSPIGGLPSFIDIPPVIPGPEIIRLPAL